MAATINPVKSAVQGPPLSSVLAAATRVVQAVHAGRSLESALSAEPTVGWGAREKSSLRDYVSGTLREWRVLQSFAHWSAGRTTFAPPVIEPLLAIAIYALRRTRVPPHTLVSQAVDASVALASPQTKGLVNAVLRGYQRRAQEFDTRLNDEPLGVQLSYPDWWVARVEADWPVHAEAMLVAGNAKPPMAVRINPLKTTREAWLALAQTHGITAHPFGQFGALLHTPIPTAQLPGFADGSVSVQDAGAQLCADALPLRDGMRVLDACSAPGGKAAALLHRAAITLTALDADATRQRTTADLLRRLGLTANVRVGDAGAPTLWWDGKPFDAILLDAPCTASGVVRRHPDGKWLKRPTDLSALVTEQARIMDALWTTLAVNGTLLYVTCSIFRAENHQQIVAFLSRHRDARLQSVVWDRALGTLAANEGTQLLPGGAGSTHNHDGFFCAALVKTVQ